MNPAVNDPGSFAYEALPSLPEEEYGSPDLLSSESYEWDAHANLDEFFCRIYRYYEEKGFAVILTSRLLNLLALGFTIMFSAFLLLIVKWSALQSECIKADTCDISQVAFEIHPFRKGTTVWNVLCSIYLIIFAAYWLYNLAHLFFDLRAAADIRHFTTHKLGLSERQLQTVTWPEVASRIVQVQKTTRLCAERDLTEHDVVSRIMRKENYLIGMLNQGVLALHIALPGMRPRFMLTKTLEWNLHWCILDPMFDDAFQIRPGFINNQKALERRFRRMAVANLLLAPFLLVFLLIYFFLRNAEKFYHSPSALGARRWSPLAAWRLREFNELPYYVQHRLNASHKAAERYVAQFPSPMLSHVAKFVSFIAGSFAAVLLFLALMDDTLLERHLYSRNLVWWAATLGIILAASRSFIQETGTAFEPELALLEAVAHTHYLPRHWRGRAHTREVQTQFQSLFQFKALLFLEEMASILLTPFILYFSLPKCAPAILRFVRDFTLHVDGLGDVCSLAAFHLERHGNSKYGSPVQAPKGQRSRQGKMEKSLISFMATYPSWQPASAAKQLLSTLANQPLHDTPHFPYTAHAERFTAAGGQAQQAPFPPAFMAGSRSFCRQQDLSIFASAEIPRTSASALMSETEWRVASSQQAMQAYYEDRDRAVRTGALHHTPFHSHSHLPQQQHPHHPGNHAPAAASHPQPRHSPQSWERTANGVHPMSVAPGPAGHGLPRWEHNERRAHAAGSSVRWEDNQHAEARSFHAPPVAPSHNDNEEPGAELSGSHGLGTSAEGLQDPLNAASLRSRDPLMGNGVSGSTSSAGFCPWVAPTSPTAGEHITPLGGSAGHLDSRQSGSGSLASSSGDNLFPL